MSLKTTNVVKEHISKYYELNRLLFDVQDALVEDLKEGLRSNGLTGKEINLVFSIIADYIDIIDLINYITNDDEHDVKDIIRQAYIINGEPIPYEAPIIKDKVKLTKAQRKALNELNIPYSIEELEGEEDFDTNLTMVLANSDYLNKLYVKSNDEKTKKLVDLFEREFMPEVPEDEVKEIHVYFENFDEDILFMDEEGLHRVAGKKARVEFLNGKKVVGYLGSDFKDEDGDDCLGLFEAYDVTKGFYDYHTYKLNEILRADVLFYPRDKVNFKFEIKVRDIKKATKGMTEKKKK